MSRKAFSMVEMVIVISVLAIVMTLTIPSFLSSRKESTLRIERVEMGKYINEIQYQAKSNDRLVSSSDWFLLTNMNSWPFSVYVSGDNSGSEYSDSSDKLVITGVYINNYLGVAKKSKTGGCIFGRISKSDTVDVWYRSNDMGSSCNGYQAALSQETSSI